MLKDYSFEKTQSFDDNIGHQSLLDLSKYSPNRTNADRYYYMSKPFRIVDVYDVAAEIGKDFERIIDQFGPDMVSGLMPKVISVLEELEEYAQRFESEAEEINTLQETIQKLELESIGRNQERARHEKELQQIEEAWHTETNDLMQMIERLQEDNRRLEEDLNMVLENSEQRSPIDKVKVGNSDVQLMIRLKEMVDKQTQEIRDLKKELAQKCLDLDAMQQQSERLAKLNAELRRKHCVSKKQSEQLLEEKSLLQVELCEKEGEIRQMRHLVVHSDSADRNAVEDLEVGSTGSGKRVGNQEFAESLARLSEAQLIEQINTEDKMTMGRTGTKTGAAQGSGTNNVPTNTNISLSQLKAVLVERNELKAKLIEVEEELAVYKNAGDYDPPVQGPVNKEPDDKLSPTSADKKESGIQKFFQSLLEKVNGN